MNCQEARQALLNSLDVSISSEQHLPMENHIATCEACRRFADGLCVCASRVLVVFRNPVLPAAKFLDDAVIFP